MQAKNDASKRLDVAGYRVLIGVTGGIAAFKVASVVSSLAQSGASVTVSMTESATKLVSPLTFQALSGQPVLTDMWEQARVTGLEHISATDAADLLVVAPATANMIGKIAGGIADDLVSTLVVSAASPVLIAPAMNERMWANPIVQGNVERLRGLGYLFVGPGEGWLACGTVGPGRMSEPDQIVASITELLLREKPKGQIKDDKSK